MEKHQIIKELYNTKYAEILDKKVQLEIISSEREKVMSSLNLLQRKCHMKTTDRNKIEDLFNDCIIEMIRTFK